MMLVCLMLLTALAACSNVDDTVDEAGYGGHRRSQVVRYVCQEGVTHLLKALKRFRHIVKRLGQLRYLVAAVYRNSR